MAAEKPAVVFAPGAWHVPAHYDLIAKRLRGDGYETVVLRHPSVSVQKDPGNMMRKDATIVADSLRKLVNDEGKDVVLVMHSYGGITGSEAAAMLCERLCENTNPAAGPPGRIRRLVYLAAHVLEKGVSFNASGRKIPNTDTNENGMVVHRAPYERYYGDISREEAESALELLQPMASSTFETPTLYAGWRDYGIPCTYIKCLQDLAVIDDVCEMYIARMKDAGVDVTVESLDTSHSPFWSAPDALYQVLRKAIE